MTLSEYQRKVDAWINQNGVRYFNELTNTAILTEEVGELARLMARVYGEQSFKKDLAPTDIKSAIADEMADILFVLACLANQSGVDLQAAVDQNIDKKSLRDASRHHDNDKLRPS